MHKPKLTLPAPIPDDMKKLILFSHFFVVPQKVHKPIWGTKKNTTFWNAWVGKGEGSKYIFDMVKPIYGDSQSNFNFYHH